MADQKRIYLTLDDQSQEELKEWADQQGRSVTNLATWLIEIAIDKAKKSGEYKPSKTQHSAQGRTQISSHDLQKLAGQLQIPEDRLLKAAKEIDLEVVDDD